MQIKMNQLLRYRNIWLGIAMVWIMLSHSGLAFPSYVFVYLKMWGYGGVDICLFASGIGCYYSLEKDGDILRFQKRRLLRLAPAYLCVILMWCVHRLCTDGIPLQAVVGNLLAVQGLTGLGHAFNWYIAGLVVMYILAPYLKSLADSLGQGWKHLLVVVGLLVLTVPFWNVSGYIIIVTRLPIFYIGIYFAKQCSRGKQLHLRGLVFYTVATLAGLVLLWKSSHLFADILWSHGWHWYPFILIVPGLCIWISLAGMALEKSGAGRWITGILGSIGKYSFEVYLVHIPLYELLTVQVPGWNLPFHANWLWLGTLPVVAVACVLLRAVANKISGVLCRKKASV